MIFKHFTGMQDKNTDENDFSSVQVRLKHFLKHYSIKTELYFITIYPVECFHDFHTVSSS